MLKKYLIITLLLFAYTIVLGHTIIPHHHHIKGHKKENTSHHHHGNHNHHHHHDHDDNSKNSDSGLAHNLGDYLHYGYSGDMHHQPFFKIPCNGLAAAYIFSLYDFNIKAFKSKPPISLHPCDHLIPTQYQLSSKGLRAPPCPFL